MTRRHHTSDGARMHTFVFPAQAAAHDGQTQASMSTVQMSPEDHHHQMLYDQVQALHHSSTYAHGPWASQGFPPHAFMVSPPIEDPASQALAQLSSEPDHLASSSTVTSLASASPPSTSASARPRTRSQTKRDAQAAMAAAAQVTAQMLPPPVPPLPAGIMPGPLLSTSSDGAWASSSLPVQTRRGLTRTTSEPVGLGLHGVKTRQRAKKEADMKPPPLHVNIDQKPGQLMFPGTMSAESSPHTALSSANQSPIAFAHTGHPAWALSLTPANPRTMTPTSTTPSLHSSAYSTSSLSPPSLTSGTASSSSSSRRPPKRKAKLTNHLRKEMLEFAAKHPKMTQTDIGIRFEVERSTVSKTLKNRNAILKELEDGRMGPKNRPTKYPDVEERMTPWVARLTEQNMQITDAMIREKALEVATELGHTPRFKASVGWVSGFKNRHGIRKGVVGGMPTDDDHMEEEEEEPATTKRRRTEKSSTRATTGEATEEDTEREEESSTLANSSQFSSGFSAISSSSVTTYEPSFEEFQAANSQELSTKTESQQATAPASDMIVDENQTVMQQPLPSRPRALSQSSAHTSSSTHTSSQMEGYISPTNAFGFHGQLPFSQPGSASVSSTSSPMQSGLHTDGFLFPALAEEPVTEEQPGTPSTQMSNMVLFTPPQALPRSSSSRTTLHAYAPTTDTIMEDEEPGPTEAANAAYHNSFGQLGAPFALATSVSTALGSEAQHTISAYHSMSAELPQSQSQPSLVMGGQAVQSRAAPPSLHHTMSDLVIPQAASVQRASRLQRSRSQSEVLFSSRAMLTAEHGQPTEFRIPELTEHFHRPDMMPHGNATQAASYLTSNVSTAADPSAKLAWLDHALTHFSDDMDEDERRVLSQVRERVLRQQTGSDLMAGQNA